MIIPKKANKGATIAREIILPFQVIPKTTTKRRAREKSANVLKFWKIPKAFGLSRTRQALSVICMRLIERPITPASHNQLGGIEKMLPR
jgi:hypothetical protein